MKLKTKNVLLLSGIIFLMACQEVVNPPVIKESKQKLVVNSIISPFFKNIIIDISVSKQTFGEGDEFTVTDAIVKISDGTNETLIPYDNLQKHYTIPSSSFPLAQEKTYRLDVTAQGQSVYGETKLPKKVLSLTSSNVTEKNLLTLSWQDFPEEGDYYRLTGYYGTNDKKGITHFSFGGNEYISDLNRNGKEISARRDFTNTYDVSTIRITSSDKIYSDYFRILSTYNGDDPFSSPIHLPSNIVGGIGIFNAVQVSEFVIRK